MKHMMSSSLDVTTSCSQKKLPVENLQLAECVGDVRALLIDILCDEIALSVESEGYDSTMEILDECHTTFLSCFNAFYPTNTLKWNCLCDLLMKKDKVNICTPFLIQKIFAHEKYFIRTGNHACTTTECNFSWTLQHKC